MNVIPSSNNTYITCPENCGMFINIAHIKTHLLYECYSTLTECPFHTMGCESKLSKRDMSSHITQNIPQHMFSFYKQFLSFKEQILSKINDIIISEYSILRTEIETLIDKKLSQCIQEIKEEISNMYQQNKLSFISHKRKRNENENEDYLPSLEALYGITPIYLPHKEMKIYYDMEKLPDGVYVSNNKVAFEPKMKQYTHKYVFTLCDINVENEHNCVMEWRFVIKAKSSWIGVGVCDKKKVVENKFKFRSENFEFNSGTFGISTNGFTWNCNNKEENNKRIPGTEVKDFKGNGEEIEIGFRYVMLSKELEFYWKRMFNGKLTNVYPKYSKCLTICVLFLNKGDEVELKLK